MNSEQLSHCFSVSFVDFEKINAGWVRPYFLMKLLKNYLKTLGVDKRDLSINSKCHWPNLNRDTFPKEFNELKHPKLTSKIREAFRNI